MQALALLPPTFALDLFVSAMAPFVSKETVIWIYFLLGERLGFPPQSVKKRDLLSTLSEYLQFFIVISFAGVAGTTVSLHLANITLLGPKLAADNVGLLTEPLNCLQVFVS